ncbi:methyl-accepting chemotaxis protein [Dactylosporangium sp. AC04546]|uniref:methyl-accepting chemotaxis protein n=1 Tax=Dactylosporangium sp. AC04546 TaxID=2862460 RepID=UPI001EDCF1B0|nr:methyl-accepting chemotaxis protein [Dactylosporangium sp. AC04546]WVK80293.1 methyl-accepting chemotaxis protein [Dactylosporangium sp. AC04546]
MSGSRGPVLLRPALWLSDRVRTSTRLAVLCVVLLVPGLGATWAYSSTIGGQVDFAADELDGTEVVHSALSAMTAITAGDAPDLAELRTVVGKHPKLELTEELGAIPSGGGVPAATALAALITEAGNTSSLILDPDLDSFYVMDIQIIELPDALLTAAQAANPDTTAAAGDRMAAQAVAAGRLRSRADALRSAVRTALANTSDPALAGSLAPVAAAADAAQALGDALTAGLANPSAADATALATAVGGALGPSRAALERLLNERHDRLARDRVLNLTVTGVGLLVAWWLAAAVLWRTRHDVGLAVSGVTATADGDLSERELPSGRDELGDIGRALRKARSRLAEQDAALQRGQRVREEQLHASFEQQREGQRQLRERAQGVVDESVNAIAQELNDVVAQVDEVRGAARTIEERVTEADRATASVVERAGQAERVVAALGDSLRQVHGTTQLIAGIAAQTRLLALNATIEAARAGGAGRGFTVVANEVKDLASNTAESTEQISATITSLERNAAEMASTIAAMVAGVGGIGEATSVLHTVAQDQHSVVERLNGRVNETMERIRGMSALAEKLERRHAERIAATGPVRITVDGADTVTGELMDLSAGGLRCCADGAVPLRTGDTVSVDLSIDQGPLRLHAQVMHCVAQGSQTEIGLQFLTPSQDAVERIKRFVATTT